MVSTKPTQVKKVLHLSLILSKSLSLAKRTEIKKSLVIKYIIYFFRSSKTNHSRDRLQTFNTHTYDTR